MPETQNLQTVSPIEKLMLGLICGKVLRKIGQGQKELPWQNFGAIARACTVPL
jgi:hypothetical protein